MAIGPDRVQVVKQESNALGGDDNDSVAGEDPIEPQEDAIESAGLYLQDASNRDENIYIARDGDNLIFRDSNNTTPLTLSELLSGAGGLTEEAHRTLRQLIHFIEDGPAEGFATGAYKETTGTVFPTSVIWYESNSKVKKIIERIITWTGVKVTTDLWKVYNTDGSTVLASVSDAISYSGIFEISRTRTITII